MRLPRVFQMGGFPPPVYFRGQDLEPMGRGDPIPPCGMGCPFWFLHLFFLFSLVLYYCFWCIFFSPWIWVGFTLATVESISMEGPTKVSDWNWAKLRSQVYLAESWDFEAKIMETTMVFPPVFPSIFYLLLLVSSLVVFLTNIQTDGDVHTSISCKNMNIWNTVICTLISKDCKGYK